jgi:hypothetical protein
MTTRESYITIKQRDLQELEGKVSELETSAPDDAGQFRHACQSARSSLDRVVACDETGWKELLPVVDEAFRHAYDCLRQVEP